MDVYLLVQYTLVHHFLQVDGLFKFTLFYLHFYSMHTADNCIIHMHTYACTYIRIHTVHMYIRKNIVDDSMQCTYVCTYLQPLLVDTNVHTFSIVQCTYVFWILPVSRYIQYTCTYVRIIDIVHGIIGIITRLYVRTYITLTAMSKCAYICAYVCRHITQHQWRAPT